MAEIQEIDLTIGPDGEVKIEVRGVGGSKCEDLTKELEAILGGQVLVREFKPKYHEQTIHQEQDNLQKE
ncbi:MAG: DUF2997 domain-containing protein [Rhodospirillaceae bacterium]|jgi:hypothetical protein|nr:DUF2997 domain-containing protein [Rhodospirillaceae bacterium]MBT4486172.1 DUF2997 domain-containing protein [Rhodospirillaceae bacterium]MBT5193513.1 DUF2997 domain-containing protein [Rhodospirillaceae bacterium]MBT7756625.1 DUF2997 domain-containing protein [Rhodospirillaceae bacterium]